MTCLTLRIDTDSPNWTAHWQLQGRPLGEPFDMPEATMKALLKDNADLSRCFEQGNRPLIAPEVLRAFGERLKTAFIGPSNAELRPLLTASGPRELRICSADGPILNLPWELIELSNRLPVGCDPAWSIRRILPDVTLSHEGTLAAGPLRILFLAAAPKDQHLLDYEREEDAILKAASRLGERVSLYFAESGGIDELADLVAECKPHVVHLSGHGVLDGERGFFAFEDERGATDMRAADVMAAKVFVGSPTRLVFLNGCQTSRAAVAGLCQALVTAGVPMALGWSASVADDRATDFAEEFFRRLLRNEPVHSAMAHARELIRGSGTVSEAAQDATFILPQLYASTEGHGLYDPMAPPERHGSSTKYTLLGDGISGLREGFIGRRRLIQRLMPALREGETTFAVFTGIGGLGKSTLATRAVNRLESSGFKRVPVRAATAPTPAESARATCEKLVSALATGFLRVGRQDSHNILINGNIPLGSRLSLAAQQLNEVPLVLVLDNFEDVLDLETRRIADPDLARFYKDLALHLTHGSRVVITCRYLPAETPTSEEQSTILDVSLPDFTEAEFLKFLRRDPKVESRLRPNDLSSALLARLFGILGGIPRLLDNLRTILRTADPDDLLDELDGGDTDLIGGILEAYLANIRSTRLLAALSPAAQSLARRVAVSELPLPVDAIASIAECADIEAIPLIHEGVIYGILQRFDEEDLPSLFHPPGLLRPWMTSECWGETEECRRVHVRLAAFWRLACLADRAQELRVPVDQGVKVCREHARQGGDGPTFQWATNVLASRLEHRSEWSAARALLEEVIEAERDHTTLHNLATIDLNRGDYDTARSGFEASLSIRRSLGDRAGEAVTLHQLARIDLRRGDHASARSGFERSLSIRRSLGDRSGEAESLHNLATIDLRRGDYESARSGFERSLSIRRSLGDRSGEAVTLHQLATIDLHRGDYESARSGFERSLSIRHAVGDRAGEAATLHNLATIDLNCGDYESARSGFDQALSIRRWLGDRAGEAVTLHQLATIDVHLGDYDTARSGFDQALTIRRSLGDLAGESETLHNIATIDLRRGDYDTARSGLEQSLAINRSIGDRAGVAASFSQLGELAIQMGKGDQGVRLLAVCWVIDESIGHGDAKADLQILLDRCARLNYNQGQITAMLNEVVASFQADGGDSLLRQAFDDD